MKILLEILLFIYMKNKRKIRKAMRELPVHRAILFKNEKTILLFQKIIE